MLLGLQRNRNEVVNRFLGQET